MFKSLRLFIGILTCLFLSIPQGWAQTDLPGLDTLQEKINRFAGLENYEEAAKASERLGLFYHEHYGYNKYTIESYLNSMKYYHLTGDSVGYYNMHMLIGDYYTHDYFMQNHAEKYLNQALTYFKRIQNIPKVIECRLYIGNILQNKEPIPQSLFTELRQTEQLSARYKQPYFQAYAQNLLATTYSRTKQPDSARFFAERSLAIARKEKKGWLIALNLFYLGITEQFKSRHLASIAYYQESYHIADSIRNLSMLREITRHSAECYSYLGNYREAYASLLKTLDYTQQFYNSEQTKSIRLQELDSQIKTLSVEKQLVEEQNRNQNVINTMLVIGLFISIIGVGTLIYLRRQQKLIARQQAVIARQQIRELELKSLKAMIEGQEGERSRIARDLHDGLGIQLSRIKLFVEAHQEALPGEVRGPLNQFLDEACTETRLISNDLRPYALSTFGLIPALEDLIQKLDMVNETSVILEHYGEMPELSDESSVMLYRVIQELLNNALKHAEADSITLQVMITDTSILISVEDDGKGFIRENHSGNGLSNIQSRIDYLGGQVIWNSVLGKGTSVLISLPK
ncbi:sensor histidine kinase [Siphonobacter sp. SORGH_AS_1065]|uniref:ATP-binding protein n=1 Tax=Siphonobacter sp. SORGH_AS_1065 TaxID=3041795 RepID=UPI002789EBC0|nr:sensor histidine kinase [Siphonobacter sp. SORGH_AS_1065]MDQ1089901.1 two-component system NarL family sensor kinase [Siphonobacter sp. SORGH_AS_1065]